MSSPCFSACKPRSSDIVVRSGRAVLGWNLAWVASDMVQIHWNTVIFRMLDLLSNAALT